MCIWRALQCYHHEISLIFIDSRHVFGPAAQLEQVKNFVELLALVGSQKGPSHKGPAKRDRPKGTSQKGPRPKRDQAQKGPWPKGTKTQKGSAKKSRKMGDNLKKYGENGHVSMQSRIGTSEHQLG